MTTPSFPQIKAQVASIRQKVPQAKVIGIHSPGRWTGESIRHDGEESYAIYQCESPLAVRLALRQPVDECVTKILITNLEEQDLGDDVLLRLAKRRLFKIDPWQIVRSLFEAHAADPRLTRHAWIAELLMEVVSPDGFSPVASGFLDAETVWPILLSRMVGLVADSADLLSLLKWSTDADNVARLQNVSQTFRDAATEWLVGLAGESAAAVLACVSRTERPDAVPVGLALGVVFHPMTAGRLDKAAGKMEERYLGSESLKPAVITAWHAAATEVARLGLSDARLKQHLLTRADEILREVGAEPYAFLSDTLPHGFDLRLVDFGQQLAAALTAKTVKPTTDLDEAVQAIFQHDRRSKERRRIERVEMSMRLVRWLAAHSGSYDPQSLSDAAGHYLREGGFVDRARLTLRSGDPVRELSEAYAKLFDRVTSECEWRSRSFAHLLCDWTAAKSTDDIVVPVEQILDRVVAPLASQTPVLVIVVDGMSVAVFRELMDDILGHDWILLAEESVGLRPGLATVPSVTEVSRTSLLCGRLAQGNSAIEQAGFAEHPRLLSQCRSGFPPVLFHKSSIQEAEDASLTAEIRKEIGSAHRKIVGVVVNAVDDHLLKGEQIDTRWTRDEIKVLPVLLHEAKNARRCVVLISDHGHILDCSVRGMKYEGGERWRFDEGGTQEGELRIGGPRVVIPESKQLIAPWTETIRYGVKKNGYHGGLTPQEMVVPIAVLSANEAPPVGWVEAPVDIPAWWEAPLSGVDGDRVGVTRRPPRKRPETLIEWVEGTSQATEEQDLTATPTPAWITELLKSPILENQLELSGRGVPRSEVLTGLLVTIDDRGGKMTSAALARALQLSPMRLRSLVAVAQRILNIDGYPVLARDETSDTIELNLELLRQQFDLT